MLYFPDYSGLAVMGTELRHFFNNQTFALEIKNNLAEPFNYDTKRLFDYVVGGVAVPGLLDSPGRDFACLSWLATPGPPIYRHYADREERQAVPLLQVQDHVPDADDRLQGILDSDRSARPRMGGVPEAEG